MSEIATRNDAWPAAQWDGTVDRLPASQPLSQGERMREWLHLFKECREAAEILARTSFVPKDMMGKPAEIATSMLKGWELGLDPLDALASIYVVHGRVGFYAEFMRRRMIQAGHVFRVVESNDSRCIVEGTRADNGETHRAVFTAEQAKRAKIDIAAYPAEKLVARATSRLVKQAFPDVLSGSLIVEDLLDGMVSVQSERIDVIDSESQPAAAAPAIQRKRQPRAVKPKAKARAPAPADVDDLLDDPEPEPAAEAEQPAPAEPEPEQADLLDDETSPAPADPDDPPLTKPQLQKLSILRQREGYADDQQGRTDWFNWVAVNIGRQVESNKDLTKAEASVLIDVLESAEAPQQ
ncbi:hypothetical protein H7H51_07710 [Mycolicibacterium farcinogenes]|nr:hypothetical protein [Mycolicibacterium farcinogenes]